MSKYQYSIENSDIGTDSVILTLKPKKLTDSFNFKPGQYAMLSFYDSAGRLFIDHPFSIASSPTQNNRLKFGIRILGKFTQSIPKLKRGEDVEILGPFGDFIFDENKYQDVVFLAGGVGITPFISAIEYATDKQLPNKINLLYSTRNAKDALFYADIKKFAGANPNFTPKLKITQEEIGKNMAFCENGYVTTEAILQNIGSTINKDFFICGPAAFMKAMNQNLSELGVPESKIHQEAFNNTPNLTFRKNYKNIFLVYGMATLLFIFFLSFVGIGKTKTNSAVLPMTANVAPAGGSPITLINNVVNNRRNSIIGTKQLLSNTIKAASDKKIATINNNTTKSTVPAQVPVVQQTITAPVPQTVVPPVVNYPVAIPVVNPRTRVS